MHGGLQFELRQEHHYTVDRNNACVALACERDGALECPDVLYSVNRLSGYGTLNSDLNRELSADPSHAQIGSDSLGYSQCWFSLGFRGCIAGSVGRSHRVEDAPFGNPRRPPH